MSFENPGILHLNYMFTSCMFSLWHEIEYVCFIKFISKFLSTQVTRKMSFQVFINTDVIKLAFHTKNMNCVFIGAVT